MNAGDTTWVLVSAGLVLVMVPGLALFYGGRAGPYLHVIDARLPQAGTSAQI